MKNFLRISAAAIAMASPAFAQTGTGSDVTGPPPGATVTFAPLPVPSNPAGGTSSGISATSGTAGAGAVTGVGQSFTSGGSITSPTTNAPIPAAALQSVGQILTSGSPAAVATVSASLQAAGAPAGVTAQLTQALAALAGATPGTAPGLIISAAQAFNNFVTSAPASFFAAGNLPPQFLAVHAALTPMVAAIR